jgi:hypothetical protein
MGEGHGILILILLLVPRFGNYFIIFLILVAFIISEDKSRVLPGESVEKYFPFYNRESR